LLLDPQQQQQQQQQQMIPGLAHSERIWRGTLEWNDKQNSQTTTRQVQCEISARISKDTNEVEVRGDNWPQRLIMQLMPRAVITNVGGHLLRDAKIVNFQWGQPSEAFESLSKVMANGFAGCVHFTPSSCDVKILILLYMPDKKSYYGFIPNDQNGYVERLRRVIQQSKVGQQQFNQNPAGLQQNPQQQPGGPRPQMMGMNPIGQQNVMNPQGGPQNIGNMQGQGDQSMMFNQQMQMQGGPNMVANQPMNPNQQRMARPPNMMQQNNLRHLLQQVGVESSFNFLLIYFLTFIDSNKINSDHKWELHSSSSNNNNNNNSNRINKCMAWTEILTCFKFN
jgi:mediator of RNA polymerase II transcription subunit 25